MCVGIAALPFGMPLLGVVRWALLLPAAGAAEPAALPNLQPVFVNGTSATSGTRAEGPPGAAATRSIMCPVTTQATNLQFAL